MVNKGSGLMILVAGPYRSGTGHDPDKMAANVRAMEAYALPLLRAGHIPVVGEWFALPLVALAGSRRMGDEAFDGVFHPITARLLTRLRCSPSGWWALRGGRSHDETRHRPWAHDLPPPE